MQLRKAKGFTLIELLVVIAIIGILAAMVLVGLSGVRGRTRDARRKSDLGQIKRALEVYRSDQTTEQVPLDTNQTVSGDLQTPLVPTYIRTLPADPTGTSPYRYDADGTRINFVLWANLENDNDPERRPTGTCGIGGFSPIPTGGYDYCAQND